MDEMSVWLDDHKILIKIKKFKISKKKLKREPSLKKLRDFTMAEGHGHPLVLIKPTTSSLTLEPYSSRAHNLKLDTRTLF